MSGKPILCLDFDGVIHSYISPWVSETTIPDPPVPGVFEWMEQALDVFSIHIYSRRSLSAAGRDAMLDRKIKYAGKKKFLAQLKFAHEKPPAFLTIDDRALRFTGNWEEPWLDPASLLTFKPWNRK